MSELAGSAWDVLYTTATLLWMAACALVRAEQACFELNRPVSSPEIAGSTRRGAL